MGFLEKWVPGVQKEKVEDKKVDPSLNEDKEFYFGRDVLVPRNNGEVEEGWKVVGVAGNAVKVQKNDRSNVEKDVPRWTLRALNWQKKEGEPPFFKSGDTVKVLRSDLEEWEDGYVVREILDSEVYLEKPIPGDTQVKKKTVPWSYVLPSSGNR